MPENDDVNSRNQHRTFWERICEEFSGRLTAYALRLANGRRCDAEDLVQETVSRILTYPKNPEETESPFSYLLTIMRNTWTTKWRKEGIANTVSLDELLSKEAQQKP